MTREAVYDEAYQQAQFDSPKGVERQINIPKWLLVPGIITLAATNIGLGILIFNKLAENVK